MKILQKIVIVWTNKQFSEMLKKRVCGDNGLEN